MSAINSIGIPHAAILTVAVDDQTVQTILDAGETMSWVLYNADFSAYVSPTRRPHINHEIKTADIVIAVIDFSKNAEQAAIAATYLQQIVSNITVVALATTRDPELILQAMRAGCSEFITNSITQQEVAQLFERLNAQRNLSSTRHAQHRLRALLLRCQRRRRFHHARRAPRLLPGKRSPEEDAAHRQSHRARPHLRLSRRGRHQVQLLRTGQERQPPGQRPAAWLHHQSTQRLEVLSSPDICGNTRAIDADSVNKLLEFLKTEYDYIVIDSSNTLNEANLAIVEASTQIYLVATPEIGAIRDLSRCVDNLMQTHCAPEKMHVVINRFSSRFAVKVEQIEKAVRLPVAIRLPNSYVELVRSVNLGEPVTPNAKSEFAQQISKWANTLAGPSTQAQQGSNLPPSAPQEAKKASIFAFFSF